ncbi:prolyl oligopeptidase family serine peptidase [Muricauda sp. TY007]|uniref:S9 family peptidase n=1 Tax=Allomuricauda sp. TY007 TaxID=2683200 RepID=UPI0013C0C75F|nr:MULTISPECIES: prolyl oligopeptidase family serine peptidase [unclassified Allomuricauda]MBA4744687.1 S9 family peptidase [Allomuricauda sp.]NDV15907.1 prolyl oligopeptidase family serine peptidase [Muricauda sp. TY007]
MVIRTDQNKGILTLVPGKGEREPKINREVLFSFILLMLATCPFWGQVTSKKDLTPKDYHRWSTLFLPQISDNGQWASYTKQYDYGQDTLFIQSTEGDTQYVHPGGGQLEFTPDGGKAIISKEGSLQLQDLHKGEVVDIGPILGHEMILNGRWLLIKKEGAENGGYDLELRSLKTGRTFNLKGVDSHLMSPKGNKLLYTMRKKGRYALHLLGLGPSGWEPVVLRDSKFPFQRLVWGPSGNSLAFLQTDDEANNDLDLYFHEIGPKTNWSRLDGEGSFGKQGHQLADYRLLIAPDNSKVLFGVEPKGPNDGEIVELWHAQDPLIYPRRQLLGLFPDKARVWAWWPKTQKRLQLSTLEHPYAIPLPRFDHALIYNPWDNEPQFKRDADKDFYLKELDTGKQQLLQEKLPYWGKYVGISENGNYLKYFKNGDWWVYHVEEGVHVNLTKKLQTDWSFLDYGREEDEVPYGSPGWDKEGNMILVYDRYDIWRISPDGKRYKRLTKGKEKGIQYRIDRNASFEHDNTYYFSNVMDGIFDGGEGLILKGSGDDLGSGYFFWNKEKGLQTLVYKPKRIYGLKKAKDTQDYIYLEETFEEPTRLVHLKVGQDPKTLAKPNAFQSEYEWGRSSLIGYRNKEGEEIEGVLVYPSGYEPGKRYPMVVHIYEQQRYKLHKSVIPTEYIKADYLNPSVFAAEGYFVLYPDIDYEIGKPGESALACVVSAVNKVVDMGLADPQRIGLYGASFGGFETTYIISQTDIFATAIAGVAITDLVSSYLSIGEARGLDEAWRYEHHQLRMGDSFTDNFQRFIENSPVYQAHNINTPLLAWVGKDDRNVHWTQSVELYLALRRLKKDHVLLVYPGEKHAIINMKKQKDLTRRIKEWMDHYLKDHPKKAWMIKEEP